MNFRTIALIEALLRKNLDVELQRYQFETSRFEKVDKEDEMYESIRAEKRDAFNRYQAAQAAYDDFIEVTWSMNK